MLEVQRSALACTVAKIAAEDLRMRQEKYRLQIQSVCIVQGRLQDPLLNTQKVRRTLHKTQ